MMQECSPGESTRQDCIHACIMSTLWEFINPVDAIMLQCSHGDLLTRAAFIHHGDKQHSTLKHYAALKGLRIRCEVFTCV